MAVTYGAADFFGGLSSKREAVPVVVVVSQLCGLVLLAVLVIVTNGELTLRTAALGGAAGVVGGIGLTCLYTGLSSGRMSVVAPITAVGAALVPMVWGLLQGERPGALAFVGALAAVVAIGLISQTSESPSADRRDENGPPVLLLAIVAGFAFGTVFVLLAETGDDAGFWPLVAGRSTSVVMLTGVALMGGGFRRPSRASMATIAPAGVLDMAANAVFLLATRRGLLALVAVLSSLYPASTVLLARLVLHERLTRTQIAGLVLAAGGVVLIATG